jgi:CelD/BcsL family acetyltransferase involved in cellulose biosynthesis
MLHRVATTAARLAHTGRVPVVHDNPEAQQWQAAQKKSNVQFKAKKAAGIRRGYGVYDTTEKRKAKKYGDMKKRISQTGTATFYQASSLPFRRWHSWSCCGKYRVFRTLLGTRPRPRAEECIIHL